jgi:hypothetical protein
MEQQLRNPYGRAIDTIDNALAFASQVYPPQSPEAYPLRLPSGAKRELAQLLINQGRVSVNGVEIELDDLVG